MRILFCLALLLVSTSAQSQLATSRLVHEDPAYYADQAHQFCLAARPFALEQCEQEQQAAMKFASVRSFELDAEGLGAVGEYCVMVAAEHTRTLLWQATGHWTSATDLGWVNTCVNELELTGLVARLSEQEQVSVQSVQTAVAEQLAGSDTTVDRTREAYSRVYRGNTHLLDPDQQTAVDEFTAETQRLIQRQRDQLYGG